MLERADPLAKAAWGRMLEASRVLPAGDAAPQPSVPPQSFHLQANVIRREGKETNQLDVDYRFLAPDFVRFLLPSKREMGRGTGKGNSRNWLMDKGQVERLDTRDNKEDRRLVNEMLALARNFLALTDPRRIRLSRLELLEGPPVPLPRPVKRQISREIQRVAETGADPSPSVTWIRLQSPDFDLARRSATARDARTEQLVSLAVGPEGVPLVAVVQDPEDAGRALDGEALLIELRSWVRKADREYRVPYHVNVYRPEPGGTDGSAWIFPREPVQDIRLSNANLRPTFVPTDFDPQ